MGIVQQYRTLTRKLGCEVDKTENNFLFNLTTSEPCDRWAADREPCKDSLKWMYKIEIKILLKLKLKGPPVYLS